jgi:hypothetical protein
LCLKMDQGCRDEDEEQEQEQERRRKRMRTRTRGRKGRGREAGRHGRDAGVRRGSTLFFGGAGGETKNRWRRPGRGCQMRMTAHRIGRDADADRGEGWGIHGGASGDVEGEAPG